MVLSLSHVELDVCGVIQMIVWFIILKMSRVDFYSNVSTGKFRE